MGVCVLSYFSHLRLFTVPQTVAHQAPLSKGFSRQEYWSELPLPPPGDLLDPGIKLASLMCPALVGGFFTPSATWETPRGGALLESPSPNLHHPEHRLAPLATPLERKR